MDKAAQYKPSNDGGARRPGSSTESSAEKMRDGCQTLSLIPAAGEPDSRFGREITKFLMQIPQNRLFFGKDEQTYEPGGNAWRRNKIWARGHQ
jgi:hypothetical protein